MDDCLVFGKGLADPWHRLSCCTKPVLLMVEFCQIQGPKPLFYFPSNISAHLSLDEVAVWLMSSENAHGSFTYSYNQQIGAYVMVQYATLLDLTARAFQRQFAIAYLTPEAPCSEFVRKFQMACIRVLKPLLFCNRIFTRGVMSRIFSLVEGTGMNLLRSYYDSQEQSSGSLTFTLLTHKIKSIAQQVLPLYIKLGQLCSQWVNCECDCDYNDLRKFINILSKKFFVQLIPLVELAPCTGALLQRTLTEVYANLTQPTQVSGTLFAGQMAVMRNFFGANSSLSLSANDDSSDEGELEYESIQTAKKRCAKNQVDTLKIISTRLIRCVYPLLAGEKIIIFAARKRLQIGQDLLRKLNRVSVRKMAEPVKGHFLNEQSAWEFESAGRLVGVICDRECSLKLCDEGQKQRAIDNGRDPSSSTMIDLNNHQIQTRAYTGRLLDPLLGRKHLFPTDDCLISFVAAVISDIGQLAVLAKYTSPHFVVRHLKLDFSDQMILYNFLLEFNVTKYSNLQLEAHTKSRFVPHKKLKF